MFNSGILDVVIGVVVVYLQLSLVCTAVNELFALWFKKRARELEKGILGLLTKPELVDKFYDHPLIQGLRPDGHRPSYIPARTFSITLLDIVRRHSVDGTEAAATQAVAAKTAARDAANSALATATSVLTAAQVVTKAAQDALTAAGQSEKLQASRVAQEAANDEAAAQAASDAAKAKASATDLALTEATTYLAKVKTDVAAAKTAETNAQIAETAAKANPKDEALKAAANAARATANTAIDALAPTASSLLAGARDQVAAVNSDVVPPELKTALLALMDNAGTNLNKAQVNIQQWFDDAMDRVSGVYKRKSHVFIVIIAVIVTVLANVDTLQVADSLAHDKALRETLVAAAPELAQADRELIDKQRGITPEGSTPSPTPAPSPIASPATSPAAEANQSPLPTPNPTVTPTPFPTPSLSTIKASLDELKKFGLPIGYIRVCTPAEENLLPKAKSAQDQPTNAAAQAKPNEADASSAEAKAQSAKIDAQVATTEAEANPENAKKKDAATAAGNKAEEARVDYPKCRKESELTPTELKQRLPTTHGYALWSRDYWPALSALGSDIWELLWAHWLGWLMTAMAISLGAPFWFDMLNKLIVVRSTVKPHEKSKEQDSKDNPDEPDEPKKT